MVKISAGLVFCGCIAVAGCASNQQQAESVSPPPSVPVATSSLPSVVVISTSKVTITGTDTSSVSSPVEAALAITEWKQQLVSATADQVEGLVASVAHPDHLETLIRDLRDDLNNIAISAPAGLSLRVAPIEVRLVAESETVAEVEVWVTQIITGAGSVRVAYSTITITLTKADGHWLLADMGSRPGPVPEPTQLPTDPLNFQAAVSGFSDAQGVSS